MLGQDLKSQSKRQNVGRWEALFVGRCPTGLLWSSLSHGVQPPPAARRPLPATQTARGEHDITLLSSTETLEAHSSAGSNCRMQMEANVNSVEHEILHAAVPSFLTFPGAVAGLLSAHWKSLRGDCVTL